MSELNEPANDGPDEPAEGRTRWRRFGLVLVPTLAATTGILLAVANGAIAVSFQIAGQNSKITADKLIATGFNQYGGVDLGGGTNNHPVLITSISSAKIYGLCQSVVIHTPIPGLETLSMRLSAGTDRKHPVEATNLQIDADSMQANASFNKIDIGVSKDAMPYGPTAKADEHSVTNSFGQAAQSATFTDVKQSAWASQAGTFTLNGLSMSIKSGKHECY